MRYTNKQIIAPVDGLTNPVSAALDSSSWKSFSVQATSTGTIAGAFQVQGSNDPYDTLPASVVWASVGASFAPTAPDTQLQFYVDKPTMQVRLAFTSSGGAGNVSAKIKSEGHRD